MAELYDSILQNYNDINFILEMDIDDFIEQFLKLKEKEIENKAWEMWLSLFPYMQLRHIEFISFEDFMNKCRNIETEVQTEGVYINQVGLF